MFHIVSSNGKTLAISPYQPKKSQISLNKCLTHLRSDLNLDATIPKLEVNSSIYQILSSSKDHSEHIEIQGSVYIPIRKNNKKIWSFIKITPKLNTLSDLKIKEAVKAIKNTVTPSLTDECEEKNNQFCTLSLNSSVKHSYQYAISIYNKSDFSSFINISEWVKSNEELSLTDLKSFKNTLFYVSEVKELSAAQRSSLALFALLPDQLKESSVLIATKHSHTYLKRLLKKEEGFLSTFTTQNRNIIERIN